MIWETIYTSTRSFQIPGDQGEVQRILWAVLNKLHGRRFWWGGRKMDGYSLERLEDGRWRITIELRRSDKAAPSMWKEIEEAVERLNQEVSTSGEGLG